MLDPRFVLLGVALSMVGTLRYSLLTVRGQVQPNRLSWFLWAAASLTGFAAQLGDGVGWPALLTFWMGAGPALVFLASFANRSSYWRLSPFDLLCGVAAVTALAVWLALDNPQAAVIFAVLGDLVAAIPTIRKAWSAPGTENPLIFGFMGVNGTIVLLTITRWEPAVWAFPVYATALGIGLCLIIVTRQRTIRRVRSHRGDVDIRPDRPETGDPNEQQRHAEPVRPRGTPARSVRRPGRRPRDATRRW